MEKIFKFDLEQPGIQNIPSIGEIIINDDYIITRRISKIHGWVKEFKFDRDDKIEFGESEIWVGWDDDIGTGEMISFYDECEEHVNTVKEMKRMLNQ